MNIYNHCWLSSFYLNELKDKSWSLYPETYGNQEALFFKIQASPWGRPGPIEKAFQVHFRDHSGKNRDIKSWQIHWDSWMKWGCKIEILWRGAAKSLQSCLTLCDTIDGSLPSSPIPGILQARTLEWVAISFSNAWKWKVKVKSESEVTQWCPTLSDPMDCSLPGSSIHGIFQARVLEWGAIAFSDSLD